MLLAGVLGFFVCCAQPAGADVCARRHDLSAQEAFRCGLINQTTEPGQRDLPAAARWYSLAAAGGSIDALNNLGQLYLSGQGVDKDARHGMALLEQAAEGGSAKAMYGLGLAYRDGLAGAPDPERADDWFESAAALGHPAASNIVGNLYAYGQGRPHDEAHAIACYRGAAEQGDAEGAFNLAAALAGQQPPDDVAAYTWFFISRSVGGPSLVLMAEEALAGLRDRMSAAEMDAAVTAIKAWRPLSPAAAASGAGGSC